MFCPKCGTQLSDTASFCKGCGTALKKSGTPKSSHQEGATSSQRGLIGYSPRINDPSFARYKGKSNAWSLIFACILFVIAVVAFPIYGNASGDIDFPTSLFYGMGIGGMFVVIALVQTASKSMDNTWDGSVIHKNAYKEMDNRQGDDSVHYRNVYVLKVKADSGRVKTHKWRDNPGLYSYYEVGDRVRHHKGFYYYEKYDKSRDTQIMCAACMTMNDINEETCNRCKCTLLK